MADKKPSEREVIQNDLVQFFIDNDLNDSYGVIAGQQMINKRSVRTVTFCKARILDATVTIYGTQFLVLSWTTAIRRLAHVGKEKFESVDQLKAFVKNNFVL